MPVNDMLRLMHAVEKRQQEITNPVNLKIEDVNIEEEFLSMPELNDVPESLLSRFATVRAEGRKEGSTAAFQFILDWIKAEFPEE